MNKYILTAVLSVSLLHSSLGSAFGLANGSKPGLETSKVTQWPVIVNSQNETLGLFGGITSGYNLNGDLESAMLLISSTGYIAPILNSGSIASLPISYFQQNDCDGQEYLPATITLNGTSLYRGMVYRSLSSNELSYIPKQNDSKTVKTKSQLRIKSGGKVECEESEYVLEVYELIRNSPELTGIDTHNNYDLAAVVIEEDRHSARYSDISSDLSADGSADKSEIIETSQEECSPACLTDAVGNGACDIECYVESCFYDKGDCDDLSPEELHMKLSTVCSPGCDMGDIGDGYCDTPCDTQACQYDGGDCMQQ